MCRRYYILLLSFLSSSSFFQRVISDVSRLIATKLCDMLLYEVSVFTRATLCYRGSLRQRRVRTSVCLSSVRLSHAGIVPSRAKAGSWNVHHLIAHDSSFWQVVEKFVRRHPKWTCQMRVGWLFSSIFDQCVVISRKRCILDTKLLWTVIGNHMQAIEWCHFRWPWVTRVSRISRVSPTWHILQTQLLYRTLIGNHRHAIDRQASYTAYNPTALT